MHPLRIIIADDHAVIREGLRLLLNSQDDLEVVGDVDSGLDACRMVEELKPDVVLMDISMPGMGGAQATKRLKETRPDVKVLVLSAHEDDLHVRQLLSGGAAGFILKRTATSELTKAIRTVASGGTYLDPVIAAKVMTGFIGREGQGRMPGGLSRREEDVLKMMAHGHTNKEIAERLSVSVKTVETYKSRFCDKLGLKSRAEIVQYAIARGWI
jgi:DNA-binding NarL/FixJ family response regulator